jgi:hypothetical protein
MISLLNRLPCIGRLCAWLFRVTSPDKREVYQNVNTSEPFFSLEPREEFIAEDPAQMELAVELPLAEDLPHRELIERKGRELALLLSGNYSEYQRVVNEEGIGRLKIYYRLKDHEGVKLNEFIYEFQLRGTPQQYLEFMADYEIQKSIDPNIKEFELIEELAEGLSVKYVQYKKMLASTPRDFVYLSYEGRAKVNGVEEVISVNTSIRHERLPETPKFVRGSVELSGYMCKEVGGVTHVRCYVLTNMAITVTPLLVKQPSILFIQKNVERILEHFNPF